MGRWFCLHSCSSAAHCVTIPSTNQKRSEASLRVYLGKYFRPAGKNNEFVQPIGVSKIVVHHKYNYAQLENDIALLRLEQVNLNTANFSPNRKCNCNGNTQLFALFSACPDICFCPPCVHASRRCWCSLCRRQRSGKTGTNLMHSSPMLKNYKKITSSLPDGAQ